MKEQDALLAAVLDAPDDDAPRLVYADWLEEHGQPERAEFIRVQVERARLPEDDARAEALKAREDELLKAHGNNWCKELPAWARRHPTFERGFVAEVPATAREFLKGAAGLFRRAPVRRVRLRVVEDAHATALAASPHLERLSALVIDHNTLTGAGWRTLLTTPGLAHITELRLWGNALGPAEAHALASASHLSQLTSLTLHDGQIGDLGLRDLAASPNMARLTSLHLLYNNGISDEGARALAASPNLANLTDLDLGLNGIGDEGVRALAESPHLGRLAHLSLWACGMSEEGAKALTTSPHLTGLRTVHLRLYGVRPETWKRIREILGPLCSSFSSL